MPQPALQPVGRNFETPPQSRESREVAGSGGAVSGRPLPPVMALTLHPRCDRPQSIAVVCAPAIGPSRVKPRPLHRPTPQTNLARLIRGRRPSLSAGPGGAAQPSDAGPNSNPNLLRGGEGGGAEVAKALAWTASTVPRGSASASALRHASPIQALPPRPPLPAAPSEEPETAERSGSPLGQMRRVAVPKLQPARASKPHR